MASNFNFSLGFNVDKEGINKAKQELDRLKRDMQTNPMKFNLDQQSLQQSMQQISVFEGALKKAFNQNLGKLDTREFMNQMHAAGYSLEELKNQFSSMGVEAQASIRAIENGMQSTNLSIKKSSKLIDSIGETFTNTLKWNLASQAIHGIEGSIGRAIGFTKDLDNSLNNIRVVTGKGKDEMKEFAKSSNEAAKALGKTTLEYTDASLIFFQQGKSASEVSDLTKATLVASSITGESAAEAAELLTAALNGYNMAAGKAMDLTDKFAAVGASTGSDFNELAIGFSKVASMAHIAGVNVDQLNGMLATISTVTREAPESIGTSLKTVFGRMTELKAGKKDEDGWELGKVSKALNQAGFNMVDKETGGLKETGKLIEEVGNKWKDLNKETQLALSTAMAGSRQQNRLIALFSNWEMYSAAVKESQEAEGTAFEQNLVRMDSIEYKSKQLRAALEEMWMSVINSDIMKFMIEGLTSVIDKANGFVDTLGGIAPILTIIGASIGRLFGNKLSNGMVGMANGFKDSIAARRRDAQLMKTPTDSNTSLLERQRITRLQEQYNIRRSLSQEDHKHYIELQRQLEIEEKTLRVMKSKQQQAKAILANYYKGSTQDRDSAFRDNSKYMTNGNIAMQQLKAYQEGRMAINRMNEAALIGVGLDKAKVAALGAVGNTIDDNIRKIYEEIEVSKIENELIKENRALLSEENTRAVLEQETTTAVATDTQGAEMSQIANRADQVGRLQNVLNKTMALTVGFTSLTSAMKGFAAAGDDATAKADAVSAGMMGIGSALMMTGNPYAMAIGAAVSLGGALVPLIDFTNDLEKSIKANEKVMKSYAERMIPLRQNLQDTLALQSSYLKFQEMSQKGGLGTLKGEEQAEYYDMMTKMAQLYPELIEYYDEEGRAILNISKSFDTLADKQKDKIKTQNDILVANKDSFVYEFTENKKKIEQELVLKNLKLQSLEVEKRNLSASGNEKKIGKVAEEMAEVQESISKYEKSIQDMPGHINTSIVQPFLKSHNAIGNMDSDIKGLISTMWNYDAVQKVLANDSKTAQEDLNNLQAAASAAAAVFSTMNEKALKGDKNAKASLDKLKTIVPATAKMIIQSVMMMPLSETQTINAIERITQKMIDMKSRILVNPLTINDIIDLSDPKVLTEMKAHAESLKETLNGGVVDIKKADGNSSGLTETADGLIQQRAKGEKDLKAAESRKSENASGLTDRKNRSTTAVATYIDSSDEVENIKKSNEALDARIAIVRANSEEMEAIVSGTGPAYIELQNQLTTAYTEQVDTMATSVEGYNQLVDVYDEQYDSIGNLMGAYEGIDSGMDTLFSIVMEGAEGAGAAIEALGTKLQNLGAPLDELKTMFPELSGPIEDVMKNGSKAADSSIKSVYEALNNSKSQMSSVFLALNRDNGAFYQTFQKTEKDKVMLAAKNLGVMASNYTTYGEYEEALKKASLESSIEKSGDIKDDAIAKTLETSQNGFNAAAESVTIEEQKAQAMIDSGTDFVKGYKLLQIARSKASQLASLDAERSQISSDINIMNSMVKTLGDNRHFWDILNLTAANSASQTAKEGLATLEARLSAVDGEILNVKNSADKIVNGKETEVDYIIKKSDISQYAPSTTGGGDKNPYKAYTTPAKRTSPTSGTQGQQVNPNAGAKDTPKSKVSEDMKTDFDTMLLHDTNILLAEQDKILKELKNDEDKLYGKAKMDNLKEQNIILEKKKTILQQQVKLVNDYANVMETRLKKDGVKFNADGTISNYNSIIESKVKAANSIVDADAKNKAKNEVKAFMDDIKQYEEYRLKIIFDKEQAIEEVKKLQHTIRMTEFDYKITVQLDIAQDRQDMFKFLADLKTEFEDLSEIYSNTIDNLNVSFGKIADYKEHLKEISEDTLLTEKEKIEESKKYQKLLQSEILSAKKLREEMIKMNEETIKKGLDLLDKQLGKYQNINNEISHIKNMLSLIGEDKNFDQLDKLYEVQGKSQKAQLESMLEIRKSLAIYAKKFKEGSDDMERANEQLAKMDAQISKMTEETLKTFQTEFSNSVNGIMDALDKQMSGGLGMNKLKSLWEEAKEEQEKYLFVQEKIVSAGGMQKKIQDQISKSTNPMAKSKMQSFLDNELKTLKEKDKLTKYDVDRIQKIYDITQAQILLDEARNNKTIQRLVRDASGNWAYQYTEDAKKVQDAQDSISSKLNDLMSFDAGALQKKQDEMLKVKIDYQDKVQDIVKKSLAGEYASQEEFYSALEEAEGTFNTKMQNLEVENGDIMKNVSESTMAAILDTYATNRDGLGILSKEQEELLTGLGVKIGTNWKEISGLLDDLNTDNYESFRDKFSELVGEEGDKLFKSLKVNYSDIASEWNGGVIKMIADNTNLSEDSKNAIDGIKSKWDEYTKKVDEVTKITGEHIDGLIKKTDDLGLSVDDLSDSTSVVIKRIEAEWAAVGELIEIFQDLEDEYKILMRAAEDFARKLEIQIQLQKEAANKPATPPVVPTVTTPTTPTTPGGTRPGTPSKPIAPTTPVAPVNGSKVKVKSGRRWYYDSYGTNPSGPTDAYSTSDLYIVTTSNNKLKYAVGTTPSVNSALGWLNQSDIQGFKTGGYTGEFGNEGRAAILHEKELVLNKFDTGNILESVKIVRDYASTIKQLIGDSVSGVHNTSNGDIQQNVQINADFSGVKSSSEIEKAFENLSNRATQFIQRK